MTQVPMIHLIMIEKLSSLDSRIKPLKVSKNGGTYVAKNKGLEQAKGKYAHFMIPMIGVTRIR